MQENQMRKTTTYLPLEMVEALKQKAKAHRRSFNSELVWAIQQYLEKPEDGKPSKATRVERHVLPFESREIDG